MTLQLVTASLHQAMRSTDHAPPYVARWSAVIGGFSILTVLSVVSLDVLSRIDLPLLGFLAVDILLLEFQFRYPC